MAKLLRRLEDGRDVFGFDFKSIEIKTLGEYEIEMVGTTADIDRDGEVLSPSGWDISNYLKNPVILPAHDYTQPAIGRAKSVRLEGGKLIFVIEFPQEGVNPLADIYRKLYKSGFMKASSVGFIPIEWTNGNGEKEPRRTYLKQELLELSLVSVPANPRALLESKSMVEAVQKGLITEKDIEAVEKQYSTEKKNDVNESECVVGNRDLVIEKLFSEIKVLKERIEVLESKQVKHYSETLFADSGDVEQKDSLEHTPDVVDVVKAVKEGFEKGL